LSLHKTVSGKPIALLLGALLVGAALFKWWPSDERAIRRELDAVADTLTVPPTDTELAKVARLAALSNHLAPDIRLRLGTREIASRDLAVGLVSRWTPPPGGVFVAFSDTVVEAADDGTATVFTTARVTTRDPQTGESVTDAREATIGFGKRDGEWLITNVDSAEAPLPPGNR
jgi:hypothetical protein